ncbi:MAG: signal peptidase II [Clostridia bacterium]
MNKLSKTRLIILTISIIVVGILIDQITKYIFHSLYLKGSLPIYFFGKVGFTFVENFGGAWSIFSNWEHKNIIFFILTILGIPFFAVMLYLARKKSLIGIIGFCGAISGTLGNAIDRLFRSKEIFYTGGVRDFISVGSWFPVFNVADMLLVCGVICVVLALFFFDDDCLFANFFKKHKAKLDENNNK